MRKYLCFIFVLTPLFIFAVTESGAGGSLTADIVPENPKPGDRVVITLRSFESGFSQSQIYWSLNGTKQDNYNNKKQFSFFVGPAGSVARIDVAVIVNGRRLTRTYVFQPAEVFFIWQAGAYTPPFYRGKALPTLGSPIKLQAVADISDANGNLAPGNLSYVWTIDGRRLSDRSGPGRDTLILSLDSVKGEKIGVSVSDPASNLTAENTIVFNVNRPEIIFYEDRPLSGVFYATNLTGETQIKESELSVKAVPYFFPLTTIKELSYKWQVNGQPIETSSSNPGLVILRPKDGTEGISRLSLSITDKLNSATRSLIVKFNAKND